VATPSLLVSAPAAPARSSGLRIAVVGAGISGLSAAYLLSQRHEVALFERELRLGGHAHTHRVIHGGREWAVDSGFLVYNHRTYPSFVRLLQELGVHGQPSDMSFSVRCRRCRLEYASHSLDGLFAQRRRVADPRHLAMLLEVGRFNRKARALLDGPDGDDRTLAEFLAAHGFSRGFARHFLLPLVGAVWSSSHRDVSGFSARALFRFLANHGWLTLDPPQWWTIGGGSARYVEALARRLGGRVHAGRAVGQVRRDPRGVEVTTEDGETRRFDRVVLATHADQALRLLADPSEDERRALAAFRYSRNRTLLHTDARSLPDSRRAWASWNMDLLDCQDPSRPLGMTYNVSRLQSLPGPATFCVSLNEPFPAPETVLAEMDYSHPVLDAAAARAQKELRRLSGQRHTYYAGAHLRYGFHEDGLRSALAVAEALGGGLGGETTGATSREEAA
jgi:predicted NAD/FAD-binding protein